MTFLRTPDERFANLPEFPFEPHYVKINGMRVHYLDEGQGEIILCLHGEPTWSFLYRKMIPPMSNLHRVMTMDFVGFGRSDKYPDMEDYSFQMHRDTLIGFIHDLGLEGITLVVQDWGGLIGLTVAFLLSALLIATAKADITVAFSALFRGAFGSWYSISETLLQATPLIYTGLAVVIAFKARIFNIGAEGQFFAGAMAAFWMTLNCLPGSGFGKRTRRS